MCIFHANVGTAIDDLTILCHKMCRNKGQYIHYIDDLLALSVFQMFYICYGIAVFSKNCGKVTVKTLDWIEWQS